MSAAVEGQVGVDTDGRADPAAAADTEGRANADAAVEGQVAADTEGQAPSRSI